MRLGKGPDFVIRLFWVYLVISCFFFFFFLGGGGGGVGCFPIFGSHRDCRSSSMVPSWNRKFLWTLGVESLEFEKLRI